MLESRKLGTIIFESINYGKLGFNKLIKRKLKNKNKLHYRMY